MPSDPASMPMMGETAMNARVSVHLEPHTMAAVPAFALAGFWWYEGYEQVTIRGLHGELKPRQKLMAEIVSGNGTLKRVPLICRIDTLDELDYFKNGGILQFVLRQLAA